MEALELKARMRSTNTNKSTTSTTLDLRDRLKEGELLEGGGEEKMESLRLGKKIHEDKLSTKLKIDKKEFFGGSMTISSLGGIGGTFFTPIINPPEVAILGIGKSFDRLVKLKGKIITRKILPISLSYDHRIIDGAEGARFCVYLSQCLGKDFAFKLAV